jgi:predicted DNA-binding protein
MPKAHKRCMGRPPAGFDGEAVSDYPQLSSRLPPDTLVRLHALAAVEGRPLWRIVVDAVTAYEREHPEFAIAPDAGNIRGRTASRSGLDVRNEAGRLSRARDRGRPARATRVA